MRISDWSSDVCSSDLRRETAVFRRNEELIVACVNLAVFIFVATALVFTLQYRRNPEIDSYLDALYFTVTTLTTTGFGDITMTGPLGRLLAVGIMLVGVALFFRLAQAILRDRKSVVVGKSVAVRVALGGVRVNKNKNTNTSLRNYKTY